MAAETIGSKIEDWVLYGKPTEPLTPEQRAEIIEYAASFEECTASRAELEGTPDHDLISAAYWAMADYARGQL